MELGELSERRTPTEKAIGAAERKGFGLPNHKYAKSLFKVMVRK